MAMSEEEQLRGICQFDWTPTLEMPMSKMEPQTDLRSDLSGQCTHLHMYIR